ncbi:uncharacterized protein LOC142981808 [Anticarsia gemmatalis]|uniref:uncharacterized protein LOC142981808 n=1 Tax=Anticarsia gemmatalis TaxID=129554 RepID=UPI003F771E3D
MNAEYIREPENKLLRFDNKVLDDIRREYNMTKKADREEAIKIIEDWIKTQDHIVKKDFSRGYIERCIYTTKGSIERTKKQIDKICTFKTLMPNYFQITNLRDSEVMTVLNKAHFALMPKLTDEHYRVVIFKVRADNVEPIQTGYYTLFFKLLAVAAEYLKNNDCCQGYILIADIYDARAAELLSKVNLVELQQFIPVITEGYGCRIKSIQLVTASKVVEGFIRMVKPLFSEKIGNRLHATTSRTCVRDMVNGDVLPEEYGGSEKKTVEELHDDFLDAITAPSVQKLLEEMNKAVTDESKRQIGAFNEQYMGMPGTFRTLSLD